MKLKTQIFLHIFFFLGLLSLNKKVFAQDKSQHEKKNYTHLTGLKKYDKSIIKDLEDKLKAQRIKKVRLNSLAIERINSFRAKLKLPLISNLLTARAGEETVLADEPKSYGSYSDSASMNTAAALGNSPVPQVDNSQLKFFPAIGNQQTQSCVGWATGYYQHTHNRALALNIDVKSSNNSEVCSPKFVYNMINEGKDQGSFWNNAYSVLINQGCVNLNNFPDDNDFLEWPSKSEHWLSAIPTRAANVQYIDEISKPENFNLVKNLLSNGYILTFGTGINGWQYTKIKHNPNSTYNQFVGQEVAVWSNSPHGGHAMTVVGYDDQIWVDVNNNNIEDSGELGAFKVANSWGPQYKNNGFVWVAYDGVKAKTSVVNGPTANRLPLFGDEILIHSPSRSSNGQPYKPTHVAALTLDQFKRDQIKVTFSNQHKILNVDFLSQKGGGYSFNGKTNVNFPVKFMIDLTDLGLDRNVNNTVSLLLQDTQPGFSTAIHGYSLIDYDSNLEFSSNLINSIFPDNQTSELQVQYPQTASNNLPQAVITSNVTSGSGPLNISFDARNSFDIDGSIQKFSWNFGQGQSSNQATQTVTYAKAGYYTVSLTVTDDKGAQSTSMTQITVVPQSAPANRNPVVYLYADKVSGPSPLLIHFNGSNSYDPEGGRVTFFWNFGNGQTSTQSNPRVTYTSPGVYTVSLTVTDDQGAKTTHQAQITAHEVKKPLNPEPKIQEPPRIKTENDRTKPTVRLLTPRNNTRYAFNSDIVMQSSSSDNVAVVKVEYFINRKKVCTATVFPFSCVAKMPRSGLKSLPVQAKAFDAKNNFGVSKINRIKN